MIGSEVDARLRRLGKTRRWLAEETDYRFESLRDALAPNSVRGISPKMAARLEAVLVKAEADMPPPPGDLLGEFSAGERRAMAELASREGYPGPHAWIIAKIRALVAMMGTKPKG
jgi:hypothetical protein